MKPSQGELLTTTISPVQSIKQQLKQQPKVRKFLEKKGTNSQNTADSYLRGLTYLQKFLNSEISPPYFGVKVNELDSLFVVSQQEQQDNGNHVTVNVYEFLDAFISYLITHGLSPNAISLYVSAVKSYLEYWDIEISASKFKNKVTMPKNNKEDEVAIDDSEIRKILLACHNFRLKVYLLILASAGLRAREALAIRLKDIDFSVIPTKIHIRKEVTKTKTARDIYISEEATTYLKQFIERKYSEPQTKRIRKEDDLIFRMHHPNDNHHKNLYFKILKQFQRLLKQVGLEERKEGMLRRKVTLHSFRRFVKTVIANYTSTDYSEWYLGHCKSPYFVQKEQDRRLLYATKCMPFLTFTDYSKLEQDATVKQTEVEALMMKDANKDRELEMLKQKVQQRDRELDLLKSRDSMTTDTIGNLSDIVMELKQRLADMEKGLKNSKIPPLASS